MRKITQKLYNPRVEDWGQLPEWPELIACLISYVAIVILGIRLVNWAITPGTVLYGLSFSALSALGGIGAFLSAYFIRLRKKEAFGLRRVSAKWLLAGVGVGIAVFILVRFFSVVYFVLGGSFTNLQEPYQIAATGGTVSFIMQLLLIAVATPIGEELAFRGVLASALSRFRPWVGILVSSTIFAVAHGFNEVTIAAFITGLGTSFLFYKTKSIWPGIIVHATNNALGTILSVLLASLV